MFVFFCFKARGAINATNRARNTVPHHGGARTFERWSDKSAAEHPEANRYVETFKKCYPNSFEDQVNFYLRFIISNLLD